MNKKLTAILLRRQGLVAQAGMQRAEIGQLMQLWHSPLSLMDRATLLARRLLSQPLGMVMGALMLFSLGRSRWSRWAGRVWTGWQIYQNLKERRTPSDQ